MFSCITCVDHSLHVTFEVDQGARGAKLYTSPLSPIQMRDPLRCSGVRMQIFRRVGGWLDGQNVDVMVSNTSTVRVNLGLAKFELGIGGRCVHTIRLYYGPLPFKGYRHPSPAA